MDNTPERRVERIVENHQYRQVVGRYFVIVAEKIWRQVGQQIGAKHSAAREVREQQTAWQDVVKSRVERVLDGFGQVGMRDRIHRNRHLQSVQWTGQALNGLAADIIRVGKKRVLVQVAGQNIRMCAVDARQKNRGEIIENGRGHRRALVGVVLRIR
jgi:hypothetical protein